MLRLNSKTRFKHFKVYLLGIEVPPNITIRNLNESITRICLRKNNQNVLKSMSFT